MNANELRNTPDFLTVWMFKKCSLLLSKCRWIKKYSWFLNDMNEIRNTLDFLIMNLDGLRNALDFLDAM